MESLLQDRAVGAHFCRDNRSVYDFFVSDFDDLFTVAAFHGSIRHVSPLIYLDFRKAVTLISINFFEFMGYKTFRFSNIEFFIV